VNKRREGNKKMALVKMKGKERKREVMQKKGALRGREERIEDDLTIAERRMQWRIEEIAREERMNNRRAMVKYARIWIEGRWWLWDEKKERLVDGTERVWKGKGKEDKERREEKKGKRGERGDGAEK